MKKAIRSEQSKRAYLAFVALVVLLLAGAGYLGYMLTRDPGIAWDAPNALEAELAAKQLAFYKKSKAEGVRGWVKLTEVELNSYLQSALTNTNKVAETDAAPAPRFPVTLKRIGVSLHKRDLTIYSWGEIKVVSLPVPFVVERTVSIQQEGTNHWDLALQSLRIGEVEVPKRFWPNFAPTLQALDASVLSRLSWTTNINAMLVAKNELSQRSELHLYTYAPIPTSDYR